MKYYSFLLLILGHFSLFAQKDIAPKQTALFFPKEKTKVLLVGTFHLDYPEQDVVKTVQENRVDVLSEPKKSELTEVVNYIKKFKPTKIAIEAFPKWNIKEKFQKYKQGAYREERDERFQLGFRIAHELNLEAPYAIDADSFYEDLLLLDSTYAEKLVEDYDFVSNDSLMSYYEAWLQYETQLPSKMHLLSYFKRINAKEYHQQSHGPYLVGDFKLDNHRGADVLAIWWYSRNLRIFRRIQEINASTKDRILVIIGNGHAPILRHLLESSPQYELIEFDKIKKTR